MARALLLVAWCAALAACAGAEAMPARALPVAPAGSAAPAPAIAMWNPGESMAFELTIGGVLAGEAQLAVGEVGVVDGHRRIRVRSRAATAGAVALVKKIVDEATTEIDVDSGRPISFATAVETDGTHTYARGTFVGNRAIAEYSHDPEAALGTTKPVEKPTRYVVDFGKHDVYDAHAAMAAVRTWRPTVGDRRTLFVMGGRRLWRVDLAYKGTETIGTALGNRAVATFTGAAYRARADLSVEGGKAQRTFTVYLSDDADRVPLRVVGQTELGDVVLELAEYNR